MVQVVPVSGGEGTYLRQGPTTIPVLQAAFPIGTTVYAVYKQQPAAAGPSSPYPRGTYVVVTQAPGAAARAVDIEQGKIIFVNLVPNNTAAKLVEGVPASDFLLPPG